MPTVEPVSTDAKEEGEPSGKRLPPAAQRALAEAAARHAKRDHQGAVRPKEIGGPEGPEPTRYGDWEVNGLASDF